MSRLRASRDTHAGNPVASLTNNPVTYIGPRYQVKPDIAVGRWIDGKLDAFICASQAADFWVLDLMVSSGDPKALRECLQFCLSFYEGLGITQFYYAFPRKWARAYRSFWKEGSELLRKYTIEDVGNIESHRIPSDPFVWEYILHENIVVVPFLLRRSYVDTGKTSIPQPTLV